VGGRDVVLRVPTRVARARSVARRRRAGPWHAPCVQAARRRRCRAGDAPAVAPRRRSPPGRRRQDRSPPVCAAARSR